MTKEEAGVKAETLFKSGYNCAQSVFCAIAPELGLDEDIARTVSLAFGGGMARTRNVCGCVSGMLMAAGVYSSKNCDSGEGCIKEVKDDCYKISQDLMEMFKKENGSIICADLLGLNKAKKDATDTNPVSSERTEQYYKKRPCPELCKMAAEIFFDRVMVKA